MPRFAERLAVAFACAVAYVAVSASDAVPQAAVGVPERPEPPQLMVLRDGKVIEGTIRFTQGGYEVDSNGGRVFLADSFVWFTARHRREAYEELKKRAPCRTADHHVALAQWCLTNRLHACAEEELRTALEQEPDHKAARSTLRTLREVLSTGSTGSSSKAQDAGGDGKTGTLGGLRPAVAEEFVTRVQPLLVNRCANASCHGSAAKNGFTLRVVRPGNPAYARLTQENLDAIRGQLSASHPETSPLLVEARRVGHGKLRKSMFPGPAGEAQLKTLATWVAQAAKSLPSEETSDDEESSLDLVGATRQNTESSEITPAVMEGEGEQIPAAEDATSNLLRKALADDRPDAFDPEEFNRQYGPQAGRSLRMPSQGPTR